MEHFNFFSLMSQLQISLRSSYLCRGTARLHNAHASWCYLVFHLYLYEHEDLIFCEDALRSLMLLYASISLTSDLYLISMSTIVQAPGILCSRDALRLQMLLAGTSEPGIESQEAALCRRPTVHNVSISEKYKYI